MNTKLVLGAVVAVVVVGGGAYFMTRGTAPAATGVEQSQNADTTGKKMAFAEFIKQGGSYKCTVKQSVNGIETEGTTYISGEMIRGDYSTEVQGTNVQSTFVVRDGYSYSWSSMMPNMGFKARATASAGDTQASASGSYSFNADQIGDYNCERWTVDAALFTVPTNITFQTIGQ